MTARPLWSHRSWLGRPVPAFAGAIQSMLRVSEGLATAGWELSARLSPQGISTQRLLVGLNTAGVAPARWRRLPADWAMPAPVTEAWQAQVSRAHQVLLAAEAQQTGDAALGVDRRIYLQFSPDQTTDALVMRGFKWHENHPTAWRQTDYHRVALGFSQAQDALMQAAHDPQRPPMLRQAYLAAAQVLTQAEDSLRQRGHEPAQSPFDMLVATETVDGLASQRSSLCFRLYDWKVDARIAIHSLHHLTHEWGHAEHSAALRNFFTHRPLGWLAVGQDRQGDPFLTLYAQACIHDAWQWTASGAGK